MNGADSPSLETEGEREDLLQLLYLCPAALIRIDAYGNIGLMNPYGAQLLMPLADGGKLANLFDVLSPFAPEVAEMAKRFPLRSGRICEEHRIVVASLREGAGAVVLSITLQKVDHDLFVAVMSDVTSAAARELFVRSSEERMHAVLNGVREYAICTLDARGTITTWNRAAERLDDYRSDEMIGRHVDAIAPVRAGTTSPMTRRLEEVKRNGTHDYQEWRVRKDGTRYWANNTISLLRNNENDDILGYSIITRDLTEERRAQDRLKTLATTDPLTGTMNRRSFFDAVRHTTGAEALSLLLLDADHFKSVNDAHGHDAGDATLVRIVGDCRKELRSTDLFARFGGEEFAIVLPAMDLEGAHSVAERIRQRVAAYEGDVPCTISIGVGQLRADESIEQLITRVDAALFKAKEMGRNATAVASN